MKRLLKKAARKVSILMMNLESFELSQREYGQLVKLGYIWLTAMVGAFVFLYHIVRLGSIEKIILFLSYLAGFLLDTSYGVYLYIIILIASVGLCVCYLVQRISVQAVNVENTSYGYVKVHIANLIIKPLLYIFSFIGTLCLALCFLGLVQFLINKY